MPLPRYRLRTLMVAVAVAAVFVALMLPTWRAPMEPAPYHAGCIMIGD